VSDLVLDASLALQWFLEDESGRQYGLRLAMRFRLPLATTDAELQWAAAAGVAMVPAFLS
jgi:hypothetical protein